MVRAGRRQSRLACAGRRRRQTAGHPGRRKLARAGGQERVEGWLKARGSPLQATCGRSSRNGCDVAFVTSEDINIKDVEWP